MMIRKVLMSIGTFIITLAAVAVVEAETIVLDGLIEPSMVVNIGSSVAGILQSVEVERGDTVQKGQVVATLKSGVEKATLELANARVNMEASIKLRKEQLEYSRRKKKRIEELYNKEVAPFSQMDEIETECILAALSLREAIENKILEKLELRRSEEIVKRMVIESPITGVVVERFLSQGEYVEDQPILKIAQIDPLHVEIIATVEMYAFLRVGQSAEVRPEKPVGGRYEAKVTIVDRVIDAASSTVGIRLELPNPDYRLPAGLKCKIVFQD